MSGKTNWTVELQDRVMDLRFNHELSWEEVAEILNLPSADVPRRKGNHLKVGGYPVPPKGKFIYEEDLDPDPNIEDFGAYRTENVENSRTEDPTYKVQSKFAKHPYKFTGDEYIFSSNNEVVSFPVYTWDAICREYSDYGAGLTKPEIAQKYGVPIKVLEKCLSLYGQYKFSAPVSRERLSDTEEEGYEPLIEDAIEAVEHSFIAKLEQEKINKLRSDNLRMRRQLEDREAFREEMVEIIDQLNRESESQKPRKLILPSNEVGAPFSIHAPIFDAHFGKSVHGTMGWGSDFNSDMAAESLVAHGEEVARRIAIMPGNCKAVYLTDGGDFFHAFMGRTKKGTPLERDRPDRLVWRLAFRAKVAQINALRQVTDRIVVVAIPGNHDHLFSELFLETLSAYYEGDPQVEIQNELGKRKYFMVGDSMHMLDHGEGMNSLSYKALNGAELSARVTGGRDYYRSKRVYYYIGHTHHREVKSHGGHLEIIRVPTFSPNDEYEDSLQVFSEPETVFFRLDEKGRIIGEERIFMVDLL